MTRIAIYARYSSELQKESSIEDQLRVCREYAEKQGWEIVQTYADKEESGSSLLRPGIQSLFEDAQSGNFELVLSERSEEHTSELQSLMRISYAVFCLKTNNKVTTEQTTDLYRLPLI